MLPQKQVNGALFGNGRSAVMASGVWLAVSLLTVCAALPPLVRTAHAQENVRAIDAVRVENSQPGILELLWDPPTETPLDYHVSWALAGEDLPSENDDQGNAFPTSPAYTIAGLAEGVCYKVRLHARYGDGAGDWTQPVVSVVQVSPPTNTPTVMPTEGPINTPTLIPTEASTVTPTLILAEAPTDTPTLMPTATPTCDPTPATSERGAHSDSGGICDRTLQVRDTIIGLLNSQNLGSLGIQNCSEVTDEYLTRIFQMDLTGGGAGSPISSLQAGDFGGLTGLRELILQDNNLRELPAGIFDGLSQLEILWMENSDIASLPDGVFDDLIGLHTLSLHGNDLASLPNGVFDRLSGLRRLAISDNDLSSLPGGVFAELGNLTALVVSDNDMTSLPNGIFSGLSQLEVANFSGNRTDPFGLGTDLEWSGEGVVVKVAEGAPMEMSITLTAKNGVPARTTVIIKGGQNRSAAAAIVPVDIYADVKVSIGEAVFQNSQYLLGLAIGRGKPIVLEAQPTPTATFTPTATPTPIPTATSMPTATPTPTATSLPMPTATPAPTVDISGESRTDCSLPCRRRRQLGQQHELAERRADQHLVRNHH